MRSGPLSNVHIFDSGERRNIHLSNARGRWHRLGSALWRLLSGAFIALVVIGFGTLAAPHSALAGFLFTVVGGATAVSLLALVLYLLFGALSGSTLLILLPDRIESPLFVVPLGAIVSVEIRPAGDRQELVAHTGEGALSLTSHPERAALEAVSESLTAWLSAHPSAKSGPITSRLPGNLSRESDLDVETLTLSSTSSRLRLRRGMILLALVASLVVAGEGFLLSFSFHVLPAGLAVMLVASFLQERLSPTTRIVMTPRAVQTARETLPLEAIQDLTLRTTPLGSALVVTTAAGEVTLARHRELAPLAAIRQAVEARGAHRRAAALAEGADPDAQTIPAALAALVDR